MAWNRPSNDGRANTLGSHGFASQSSLRLADKRRGRSPHPTACGVVGMIVVLGAAIAAWVIFSGSDDASAQGAKHKAQGTIREVAPAAAPKAKVVEEKKPVDLAATGKPWPDRESKLPADISRAIKELGVRPGMYHYKNVGEVLDDEAHHMTWEERHSTLDTATEQHLYVIAAAPPEMIMPPLPPGVSENPEDFLRSLENEIKIWDKDSPEMKKRKKSIIEMKEMMRQMIDSGATLPQAFAELEAEHNRKANLFQLMKGEYVKMTVEENPDAAAFLRMANERLAEQGCPLIAEDATAVSE